nr:MULTISPECIES: hypothetical protein [unclassified Bradyrhizobium]
MFLGSSSQPKERAVQQRRRVKQALTLEERLANEADRLREQADHLPAGKQREELLLRARQAETASHITEWLTSPGLKPPT